MHVSFSVNGITHSAIVHEAEEGGYWAEVPAIPGCATHGDTFEELLNNLYEAVEGCLLANIASNSI
jgi:predicted RNase H-like HicB family nuclease